MPYIYFNLERYKHQDIIEKASLGNQTKSLGENVMLDCNLRSSLEASEYDYVWFKWVNGMDNDLLKRVLEGETKVQSVGNKVSHFIENLTFTNRGSRQIFKMERQYANRSYTCVAYNRTAYDFSSMFLTLKTPKGSYLC